MGSLTKIKKENSTGWKLGRKFENPIEIDPSTGTRSGNSSKTKAEEKFCLQNELLVSGKRCELTQTNEKLPQSNPIMSFNASTALDNTFEILRSFACLECLGKRDDDLTDCSIPSKVYLTDCSRANTATCDKSIGGYLVMKNQTFHSVDTTQISSLPSTSEKNTKECMLLDDDCAGQEYDESDLILQRSVSPLSCPSFSGQSVASSDPSIVDVKGSFIQTIHSKDSLLSFDESSTSGALLDMLSMDSDDHNADNKANIKADINVLSDLCEQSMQSSVLSTQNSNEKFLLIL